MIAIYKRWMMFVDGENLTITVQNFAKKSGTDIQAAGLFSFYLPDVYYWPKNWVLTLYAFLLFFFRRRHLRCVEYVSRR
jgi:hypothetical protein